jgi:hypothetical protein
LSIHSELKKSLPLSIFILIRKINPDRNSNLDLQKNRKRNYFAAPTVLG